MLTREVGDELAQHHLQAPDLEMLRPTEAQYSCFLLQPAGPIHVGAERIGPRDARLAARKALQFLRLARDRGAHLAVTPEYFLPWEALKAAINEGVTPAPPTLWVLGCESITVPALAAFTEEVSDNCLVIHEHVAPSGDKVLLDPAVLLFQATKQDGSHQVVALVQFKTLHSRDDLFLEERRMLPGTVIYRFRGRSGHLSASAIICSDALALAEPQIGALTDRATLIHVQLNPNPRHTAYRHYRSTTFLKDPDITKCHIVALNWSPPITQRGDGDELETWAGMTGSTWYCPLTSCASTDDIVVGNHLVGLYYAYMTEKRHALLFHYGEAAFELRVPKLVTTGLGVMVNRNGPTVAHRYEWLEARQSWTETGAMPESGFPSCLHEHPELREVLEAVANSSNVLGVERLLVLSCGAVSGIDNWYDPQHIDSCQMSSDEIAKRITFALDPEQSSADFRFARLARVDNLRQILRDRVKWPSRVQGLSPSAEFKWDHHTPHHNVFANGVPTLVVLLGSDLSKNRRANTADKLLNLLRRAGGPYQHRLCVMYHANGELRDLELPALTRIDDPNTDSTDIGASPPMEYEEGEHG